LKLVRNIRQPAFFCQVESPSDSYRHKETAIFAGKETTQFMPVKITPASSLAVTVDLRQCRAKFTLPDSKARIQNATF